MKSNLILLVLYDFLWPLSQTYHEHIISNTWILILHSCLMTCVSLIEGTPIFLGKGNWWKALPFPIETLSGLQTISSGRSCVSFLRWDGPHHLYVFYPLPNKHFHQSLLHSLILHPNSLVANLVFFSSSFENCQGMGPPDVSLKAVVV